MKLKLKHLRYALTGFVMLISVSVIAFIVYFMVAWAISWNNLYKGMVAFATTHTDEIVREVALLKEKRLDEDIFSLDKNDEDFPRIVELNPHWMYWDDEGFLVLKVWGADRTYMGLLVVCDEFKGEIPNRYYMSHTDYTYKTQNIAPGIWAWK